MTTGEKIQSLRAQKQISQEELASSIGVSRQAISKWETDQSVPDLENMKWLAEFFHVKLSSLIEDGDIELQQETQWKKQNTLLRTSRILFSISIGICTSYFLSMLMIIVFQDVFKITKAFIFPIPTFIFNIVLYISFICINSILFKEAKKDSTGISKELAFLIVGILGTILLFGISSYIEQGILAVKEDNTTEQIYIILSYSKLLNSISGLSVTWYIGLFIFVIGASLLLSAKYISLKGYTISQDTKPYHAGYGLLSFILGFISIISIPPMVYWLKELKQQEITKYKHMKILFLLGVSFQICVYVLVLIFLISIKL